MTVEDMADLQNTVGMQAGWNNRMFEQVSYVTGAGMYACCPQHVAEFDRFVDSINSN